MRPPFRRLLFAAPLCLAALLCFTGQEALAFPDATPWDEDCHACHTEAERPGGRHLRLEGLPATASPGSRHRLAITLDHPDMRRAGMRLLVLGCDGRAGRLAATGDGLETEGAKARTTYDGTTLPRGVATKHWELEWHAPDDLAGACDLTFSLRANAANDDLSPLGDVIYRIEQKARLSPGG